MESKRYTLFSNGTECMDWQSLNCEKCKKGVFYNEKRGTFPKYRCSIQREIEFASVTDGTGTKRAFDATREAKCKYFTDERKTTKRKKNEQTLSLF